MPPREQAGELIPPRDGIAWRVAGDARLFAASGYALLLQVAHPSVGAGVTQHSDFKADPWGRLVRTLDYTSSMVYGGPEVAWRMGRRVRDLHKPIRGLRPDGKPYRALEPGPWAWVHATLAESIVRGHELFCGPRLTAAETEAFWLEWRRLGRLIGVRYEDLPESWPAMLACFARTVEEELECTEAAQDVLGALHDPAAPPLPALRRKWIWRLVRFPPSMAGSLATLGMLPPTLRARLGIEWNASREWRFRRLAALSRRAGPLLPPPARSFGPHYLRWRGQALARAS